MLSLHLTALVAVLALAPAAEARIFGTTPIPVSVGPNGEGANGPSGGAAISGDDRKTRYAAFHSEASNLVDGDANGAPDVFVWRRPAGRAGLELDSPARPGGPLQRASVGDAGQEANAASLNPSLDGDRRRPPHCVAFESFASNLTADDPDGVQDVFVRDLRAGRTFLVSRGVPGPASNPAIDGSCSKVVFESGGAAMVAGVRGGGVSSLGAGHAPDMSADGRAIAFERGTSVLLRRSGRTSSLGRGSDPKVSDRTSGRYGVALVSGSQCFLRIAGGRGGSKGSFRVSVTRRGRGRLGGRCQGPDLTLFAPANGQVHFTIVRGGCTTLYYWNKPSRNTDDLARACGGSPAIDETATSARGNFDAFVGAGSGTYRFDRNGGVSDVFVKHLGQGQPL